MTLGSFGLAFLAGLLSTLSPCVLPLLPIVLGTAASEHRFGAVALAVGLVASFVAIGLFFATIGFSIGLDAGVFRTAGAIAMISCRCRPRRTEFPGAASLRGRSDQRLCAGPPGRRLHKGDWRTIWRRANPRRRVDPLRRANAWRRRDPRRTRPESRRSRAHNAPICGGRRRAAIGHRPFVARGLHALARASASRRPKREDGVRRPVGGHRPAHREWVRSKDRDVACRDLAALADRSHGAFLNFGRGPMRERLAVSLSNRLLHSGMRPARDDDYPTGALSSLSSQHIVSALSAAVCRSVVSTA